MNTIHQPSTKQILWLTLSSILAALILLFIAVLPAEFDIDPTGLGKKLGLNKLYQTSSSTVQPTIISCPEIPQNKKGDSPSKIWQDTVSISVPPKKGLEYKFYLKKDEQLEFIWQTNGTKLFFDFHGEPEGDKTGYFKSYKKSTQNESSGTLSVPFSGPHGWYWENNSNESVTIILKTKGNYKIIGLI